MGNNNIIVIIKAIVIKGINTVWHIFLSIRFNVMVYTISEYFISSSYFAIINSPEELIYLNSLGTDNYDKSIGLVSFLIDIDSWLWVWAQLPNLNLIVWISNGYLSNF